MRAPLRVNAVDNVGVTALYAACLNGDAKKASTLLDCPDVDPNYHIWAESDAVPKPDVPPDADPTADPAAYLAPPHYFNACKIPIYGACANGHASVLREVIRRIVGNAKRPHDNNKNKNAPIKTYFLDPLILYGAVARNDPKTVNALLTAIHVPPPNSSGATSEATPPPINLDVNATYQGFTALYLATSNNFATIVKDLLSAPNIDVDVTVAGNEDTPETTTAVEVSVVNANSTALVSAVGGAGATKTVLRKQGMTPLYSAVGLGSLNMVQMLLAAGADPIGSFGYFAESYDPNDADEERAKKAVLYRETFNKNRSRSATDHNAVNLARDRGYTEIVDALQAAIDRGNVK